MSEFVVLAVTRVEMEREREREGREGGREVKGGGKEGGEGGEGKIKAHLGTNLSLVQSKRGGEVARMGKYQCVWRCYITFPLVSIT